MTEPWWPDVFGDSFFFKQKWDFETWPDPDFKHWRNMMRYGAPITLLPLNVLLDMSMNMLDVVICTGIADSKSDAHRTFKQRGFRVNNKPTDDSKRILFLQDLCSLPAQVDVSQLAFGDPTPEPVIMVKRGHGGIRYGEKGEILPAQHMFVFTPYEGPNWPFVRAWTE